MFRALRTLPKLRQLPLRTPRPTLALAPLSRRSLISRNGPVNVQNVRIVRPVRFTRLVNSTLRPLTFACLAFYVLVLLFVDDDEDEAEALGVGQGEEASVESKEDETIFIPLGFAYQLPQRYYKGSDPEWQSFIQLSKNKKLCEFLKNQLTGLVGQHVGSLPPFKRVLGENNKPRKFWIDIDFPQGPPPEYERKGLEVSDDHISWTTRPVHPLHYSKLQKALWPASLASSVWASQKTFVSLQYAKLKSVLALSADSDSSDPKKSRPSGMQLQKISEQTGTRGSKAKAESDSGMPPESSTFQKAADQPPTKSGLKDFSKLLSVTPPDMGGDTVSAVQAFKNTFAQTWQPAHAPLERGIVMFSGLIELVGPKGVAVLDVQAAYHPGESRWTHIAIAPRRIQPKQQVPRGGR